MSRVLLALLLATTVAEAKLPVNKMYSRRCQRGSCQMGQGTGIPIRILKGKLIWTTAGHCLGDWNAIEINGEKYVSDVIARVPVNDLFPDEVVYLSTRGDVSRDDVMMWVPEPDYVPRVGDKVWLIGFPYGKYSRIESKVLTVDGDEFTVLPHADVGASGGAVILQEGKLLIGTIHACYIRGKQEGIMSRFDVVCDRLRRDGHTRLVPQSREGNDGLKPTDPGNGGPVASNPALSKGDIAGIIADALAAAEEKRKAEAEAREREEADRRGDEARRRAAAEREAAERHQAEIQKLRTQLEEMRARQARDPVETPVEPPVVERGPVVVETPVEPPEASNGVITRLADGAAELPWGLIGTIGAAAGLAVPGGALGLLGLRLGSRLLRRRKKRRPSPPSFPTRDTTEAEELLQLRANEGRNPVHDALYGCLWQDVVRSQPDKTGKELESEVLSRFNSISPISSPRPEGT